MTQALYALLFFATPEQARFAPSYTWWSCR